MRKPLLDALETVQLTHDPDGHLRRLPDAIARLELQAVVRGPCRVENEFGHDQIVVSGDFDVSAMALDHPDLVSCALDDGRGIHAFARS